jgi:hypothetical protein
MIRSYSWLIISPPDSSNTSAGSRLMMSSMFLAITSVSAGVAARLAGASAASSAAAATQPMPIRVMICLPADRLAGLATCSGATALAGRPADPAAAGAKRMAAIMARDRPGAQQKAIQRDLPPFGRPAGSSRSAA